MVAGPFVTYIGLAQPALGEYGLASGAVPLIRASANCRIAVMYDLSNGFFKASWMRLQSKSIDS